jgi:hypothetical protein
VVVSLTFVCRVELYAGERAVSSALVYHKHASASEIVCSTNFGTFGGAGSSQVKSIQLSVVWMPHKPLRSFIRVRVGVGLTNMNIEHIRSG